jgi:hypothetical protein
MVESFKYRPEIALADDKLRHQILQGLIGIWSKISWYQCSGPVGQRQCQQIIATTGSMTTKVYEYTIPW